MSRDEAQKKIEKLKVDERVAIEQLKEAERQRETLDDEMKALQTEEKALEEEEAEWVVCVSLLFTYLSLHAGSGELTTNSYWSLPSRSPS